MGSIIMQQMCMCGNPRTDVGSPDQAGVFVLSNNSFFCAILNNRVLLSVVSHLANLLLATGMWE